MKGIYRLGIVFVIMLVAQPCWSQQVSTLLHNLDSSHDDTARVSAFEQLINYYQQINSDSAYYYGRQGIIFSEKIASDYGRAVMLMSLGKMDHELGNLLNAKEELTNALLLFKKIGNDLREGEVYNCLAHVNVDQGNYKVAMSCVLSALKIFEAWHNEHGIAAANLHLGSINAHLNNTNQAIYYYYQAKIKSKKNQDPLLLLSVYNNLAIMYGKRGMFDSSIFFVKAGLEEPDVVNFPNAHVSLLDNIGCAYIAKGDTIKAIKYFNDALAIVAQKKMYDQGAYVFLDAAPLYYKKDPTKALAYINEALTVAKQQQQKRAEAIGYESLSDFFAANNNFKEAFDAIKMSYVLRDSIADVSKAEEIASMQSGYELAKSVKEVENLKEINNRNLFQRNIILLIAITTFIVIFILLVYSRKSREMNRQLLLQQEDLKALNKTSGELNSQLLKRKEELKDLNLIKDKVFSVIGHDLRSPLIGIMGMLQLLENENTELTDEYRIFFDLLKSQTRVTLDTLDKLLYWGKSSIQGVSILKESFIADPIIKGNIDLLKNMAAQKKIDIINSVNGMNIELYADSSHFDFVIRNLISNAIKFTPLGGRVSISAQKDINGKTVTFAVQDTGIGINEEETRQIFDHNKVSKIGTANEKGMGIGLMLCKDFVTQNGGKLWFVSKPGEGTTFFLSLSIEVS